MNIIKKMLALFLCALTLACLAGCGGKTSGKDQIPNPFTDCETLEEAEQISGVFVDVPAAVTDAFSSCVYRAAQGLIEIIYTDGKDGDEIRIRKGTGTDDISGDYNRYDASEDVAIADNTVTFKGNDGKVSLAVWTAGGEAYAVSASVGGSGITKTMMTDIIRSVGAAAESTALADGWEYNQGALPLDGDPAAKAAFEKALGDLDGCDYEPVALLGSRTAAGTDFCILCRATPVVPDPESSFVLLYVHADAAGGAAVTGVADIGPESAAAGDAEAAAGGWQTNRGEVSVSGNADVNAALGKALDGLVGADYEAVAYLADRVSDGADYCLLCKVTPVVPDARSTFSLVVIHADPNGNAQISDVTDLDLAGLAA
ncbi:MAG: hypothetical protein VB021_08520 [Oscillospiraceae bacterium]|nr:hypothetical protein [Oscillospiraceae bacterium]